MSKYAPVVRGIQDAGTIRETLIAAAIDGLRRQAGYIPDVMPLNSVLEPVDLSRHSCPYDPGFEAERYLWLRWCYPSLLRRLEVAFWTFKLPWADRLTYHVKPCSVPKCCQRVQAQHIDIGCEQPFRSHPKFM